MKEVIEINEEQVFWGSSLFCGVLSGITIVRILIVRKLQNKE